MPVDSELTRPVQMPIMEGDTWRDLMEGYIRRGAAIESCNDRLEVIHKIGR